MAVNFFLDKRVDKKGDVSIRVSFNIRGAGWGTSSGFKIAPAKWDETRKQVRRGCSNGAGVTWAVINAGLAKIADHFATFENACLLEGKRPTVDDVKDEYSAFVGKKRKGAAPQTLFGCLDKFVAEESETSQWTESTEKKFAAFRNHLSAFNDSITFDDLSEEGLKAFVAYLRDVKQMRNTSIANQVCFAKWFLRWATAKGYNTNTAFLTFQPKLKTIAKKVVFLDWEELMRVYNYAIPANGVKVTLKDAGGKAYTKVVHDAAAIAKTRDIFCFCCFTSLRYSDANNLKRSDIEGSTLTLTTIKTSDTLTIELNKYALSILEKYADRRDLGDYVFPHITNQRMNIYLKDLCELCGINQLITQTYYKGSQRIEETLPKYELIGTHTGRRTFICNALMLGIPAEIVMKWTGHSDYKAMKPYIDVTNAAKAKAMDLFNKV